MIEPATLTATEARLLGMAYDRYPALKDDVDLHALVSIIRAELEAVERHAGGLTDTETFIHKDQLPRWLVLLRPVVAITGITERWRFENAAVVLTAADYRLVDAQQLLRLSDGPNRAATWGQQVAVSYEAVVDQELRDQVVLELVQLDVSFRAHGRHSETIGDYSITTDGAGHEARRGEVLHQLSEGRAVFS